MTRPWVGRPRKLVSILDKDKNFSPLHSVKAVFWAQPAAYKMATEDCNLGGVGGGGVVKVADA